MKLDEKEVLVYNFIKDVIDTFMNNYNYMLVYGNVYSDKFYEIFNDKIVITNNNDDDMNKVELISLGYNILNMLTENETELIINKDSFNNILNIICLNLVCNKDDNELKWEYSYQDMIVGRGNKNSFSIDILKLIDIVKNNISDKLFNKSLDVNIECISEEERFNALVIANDLRLNDIITDINSNKESKIKIIIKEQNLSKGILKVIDNSTLESSLIDEAEIVDYILGII